MLEIALVFLTYCSIRLQDKHAGLRFCSENGATILSKRWLLPIRLHGITFQKTITCISRENLKRYCRLRNLFTLSHLAEWQLTPTLVRNRWQLMSSVLDCGQANRKDSSRIMSSLNRLRQRKTLRFSRHGRKTQCGDKRKRFLCTTNDLPCTGKNVVSRIRLVARGATSVIVPRALGSAGRLGLVKA